MSEKDTTGTAPVGEGKESKDDVNDLLEDWDKSRAKPAAEPTSSIGDTMYALDKAVSKVKGDLEVEDKFVRQFLRGLSDENADFAKAWDNQMVDPDKWDETLKDVSKRFQTAMRGVREPETKDDDKQVAAATRASREVALAPTGYDDVNFADLSDAELAQKKAEIFRLAAAGQLT